MSTGPDQSDGTAGGGSAARGWDRLPRWQHNLLIALCVLGLVAAIANIAAASSNGQRALHAAFALLDGAILVSLVIGLRRRQNP